MVNYVITGKVKNDFLEGDEDIITRGEFESDVDEFCPKFHENSIYFYV